jgi:hypothetical protein
MSLSLPALHFPIYIRELFLQVLLLWFPNLPGGFGQYLWLVRDRP